MSETHQEFYLDKSDPAAWAAFGALSKQAGDSARTAGLDDQLIELVCLRVSQINGCAYCLKLHTRRAIKAGVSDARRALVSAWEESSEYSLTEKAALFLAETVTQLPCAEDRSFAQTYARGVLTDDQYSAVQWLAITMNAANRISIMSQHPA
ncbi:carboxymuconolactone decarboxylase [Rothia nasimurium]|uniref:Carboxymuconolactone decarboxylase n=1 Tax=Rothia nasimurium TaxID=85336 RepID=A0A1Y1RN66_9MICC|nr:carboxymuconolactone decarboxylase family protein [Rothia nasimurium]ORC16033.1 carboxymuconolactone decarboxylase [Rothia nasimurium]